MNTRTKRRKRRKKIQQWKDNTSFFLNQAESSIQKEFKIGIEEAICHYMNMIFLRNLANGRSKNIDDERVVE